MAGGMATGLRTLIALPPGRPSTELVQDLPRYPESSGRRQCLARSLRAPSSSAPAVIVYVAPEESHRSISLRSESTTDLGLMPARCRASIARHATGAKTQQAVILKVRDVPSWPYASPLRITLTRMCCIDPLSPPPILLKNSTCGGGPKF